MAQATLNLDATDTVGTAPQNGSNLILATLVLPDQRLNFLPNHFGRDMLRVENAIYDAMGMLCPGYRGGFWDYLELSNGGCYMRPHVASTELWAILSPNGHEAQVSADAAGLLASLFGINGLTFAGLDKLVDPYYSLLDFARQHAEARDINDAID